MPTRFISSATKLLLLGLKRASFLAAVDLSKIMTDNTETLLNLPGLLPFFPTKAVEPSRVSSLISRLYPVTCGHNLIRLGSSGDGGYLVPDDLAGIEACFSPGVSDRSAFELDCARMGMDVFMADASVDRPSLAHPRFQFIKKHIGANTVDQFVSLEDWVRNAFDRPNAELLLQMDIEGYEYEALLSTPSSLLKQFRIIIVEFHYLDYMFSEPLFAIYSQVFTRLLNTHTCVHIHPNNVCPPITISTVQIPQIAEFTFLRTDRVVNPRFVTTFPHPLDCDNTNDVSRTLPNCLYHAQ